jgi:hypothetical protein
MDSGRKRVAALRSGGESSASSASSRPKRKNTVQKNTAPKSPAKTKKKNTPAKRAPTASKKTGGAKGRPGPKAFIARLIGEDFFSEPRTIGDVVAYASESLALHYKSTDFGSTLVRLLKEGRLKRMRNADGQYEYRT